MEIVGPKGKYAYLGGGEFHWKMGGMEKTFKEIRFIGAGSGITPLYYIILHMIEEMDDTQFKLHLLYGNKTESDILLKKQLDEMNKKERVDITYTLSRE